METIFIRLATLKEQKSQSAKHKAMNSIPVKPRYEIVYKPYGEQGRGFYYQTVKSNPENLFKDYYGREATAEFDIDLADMSKLTMLGKVHAVEYVARKHNDKNQQTYRHVFKQKPAPILLWNGKELLIYGNIEVNKRGII